MAANTPQILKDSAAAARARLLGEREAHLEELRNLIADMDPDVSRAVFAAAWRYGSVMSELGWTSALMAS